MYQTLRMTTNKLFHSLYYNTDSSACFSNVSELEKAAVRKSPHSLPGKSKKWLNQQLTHSLHKPARRRFPRNRYFVRTPGELAQADIADLSMFGDQNDGFKYLLTFIDVFSKKAFVVPLKTKTGNEMKNALTLIFKKFRPQSLQTDRGTEFINGVVKQFCKQNGVNLFFTYNQDVKCAVVERFNRTLKGRMFKYFTANATRKYIDILDKLVNAYNNSYHRTIKMTPNQVTGQTTLDVFNNTYGKETPRDYIMNRQNEEKTKFVVGDRVRVKYVLTSMDKAYYPNWSDQVFKVISVSEADKRDMYEIEDELRVKQPRRFYSYELQKIEGEPVYRIEKVIKHGKTKSLVKWLNHPESFNSWVKNSLIKNVKRSFTTRSSN